ncbi:MAG: hypothetical protein K8R02_03255 [Anaerohalosphaeraceae bacterium]|nr:hypothetical protein [Anaerohalosphaeraceae bacterium]
MIFLVLAVLIIVIAIILMVAKKLIKLINAQELSLSELSRQFQQNAVLLKQISQDVKLSDAARTIAYRDIDRGRLGEAVMEKLHQGDFEATYAMIDDIANRPEYKTLASELRTVADNYKNATEKERLNQVARYIEILTSRHQWTTASIQAERLIKASPDSDQARQVKQSIIEKKQMHKRQLLAEWDEAVKKDDTDTSLRILKELDLYLTPSEGLALQEAASQVFKNKLHNMGVQFSLAVADKQWANALKCADDITREFPNSKMAREIRSKHTILIELASK